MFRIAFYKGKGDFYDKAIRLWQSIPRRTDGSQYSHCEMIIGATTISADADTGKVIAVRNKIYDLEEWDILKITNTSLEPVRNFITDQINKRYDYIGIFTAQVLALSFDDPKAWFCSELCAACLKRAGIELEHYNAWYNPRRLYDILTDEYGFKKESMNVNER